MHYTFVMDALLRKGIVQPSIRAWCLSVWNWWFCDSECESQDWDNWIQNHVEDIGRKMYWRQGTNTQVGFIDILVHGTLLLRQWICSQWNQTPLELRIHHPFSVISFFSYFGELSNNPSKSVFRHFLRVVNEEKLSLADIVSLKAFNLPFETNWTSHFVVLPGLPKLIQGSFSFLKKLIR